MNLHKSFKLLTLKQMVDENVSLHEYFLGISETFNQVVTKATEPSCNQSYRRIMEAYNN